MPVDPSRYTMPSESVLAAADDGSVRLKPGPKRGKDPLTLERKRKAVVLKIRGATYAEIASALGVTRETAMIWVRAEMKIAAQELRDASEVLLAEMVTQCDALIERMSREVYGPKGPDPECARVLLRAIERKAKLLGIEAPDTKIDVTLVNNAIGPVVEAILAAIPADVAPAVFDAVNRMLAGNGDTGRVLVDADASVADADSDGDDESEANDVRDEGID